MPFSFHPRQFLTLSLLFIAFVIAGTLLHECGHYGMAKLYGHKNATIHYNYTLHGTDVNGMADRLWYAYQTHAHEIDNNLPFPGKEQYNADLKQWHNKLFWISAGGPIQTILTGTLALGILVVMGRHYRKAERLQLGQWLLMFFALFWLRQPVNLATYAVKGWLTGKWSTRSDEVQLAKHLGWGEPSVLITTAVLGLAVLAVVVFRYIPLAQRFTFMCAAIVGGAAGYILWMHALGPAMLP